MLKSVTIFQRFICLLDLADKNFMALPVLNESSAAVTQGKKNDDSTFFEMGLEKADLGRPDSLRYNILTWVLSERYDKAIQELSDFLEKPSDYPNFKEKVARYVNHSTDLIYAIKAKRSFPGINSLTRAKQQELREKFKGHYKELQYALKIIEKIHGDLRIQDARSTIYVMRALCIAVVSVLALALWLEIVHGLMKTSVIVLDDSFGKLANFLAEKVGF